MTDEAPRPSSWTFVPKPAPSEDDVRRMNEMFAVVDGEPSLPSAVFHGDFRDGIATLADESVQLVWTDPPFGTGQVQRLVSTKGTDISYRDVDRQEAVERVVEMARLIRRKMKRDGLLCICLDHRIVHEVKVEIDSLGGWTFAGEIVYHFQLGGVTKNWWTNKHNLVLMFGLDGGRPKFNYANVPTTERQAKRGTYTSDERKVNSVWSITMGPSDSQRTGYPNQKPLDLVRPFVAVHTDPDDLVVDPFAGSGTTGAAAKELGRRWLCIDSSTEAVRVMLQRGLD